MPCQTQGFSIHAHTQSKELWIEDGGKMMVGTSRGMNDLLYRIKLNLAVCTCGTKALSTSLFSGHQFLLGQIHRQLIVYAP